MKKQQIKQLLTQHQLVEWQRINADLIQKMVDGFIKWPLTQDNVQRRVSESEMTALLAIYLQQVAKEQLNHIADLHHNYKRFTQYLNNSESDAERHIHILGFAQTLGQNKKQRATDQAALKQHFDRQAVIDRYHRQRQNHQRFCVHALEQIGYLMTQVFHTHTSDRNQLWQRFQLMSFLPPILSITFDERIPTTALKSLNQIVTALPEVFITESIDDHLLHFINRASLETSRDTELQRQAIDLLAKIAPNLLDNVLLRRLSKVATKPSDFFVRCHAVQWLCQRSATLQDPNTLIQWVYQDPSDHVRQRLAENLWQLPKGIFVKSLPQLLQHDISSAVRCATLLNLQYIVNLNLRVDAIEQLSVCMSQETNSDVLRCLAHVLPSIHQSLIEYKSNGLTRKEYLSALITRCHQQCLFLLNFIDQQTDNKIVQQAVVQAKAHLWRQADHKRHRTFLALKERIALQPAGHTFKIQRSDDLTCDDNTLTRLLSQVAQDDHGLDVDIHKNYIRVRKGHHFGVRLWRLLHELRYPATDKRQAFKHWIGRIFYGHHHFPSHIMAERSPTTVPGEPRIFNDELSWRPWLPLVDELISSLDQDWPTKPVNLYTPEGVTEIIPPNGLWQRLKARTILTWRFAHYARLRNWDHQNGQSPKDYMTEVKKLGFCIQHKAYTDDVQSNPSTQIRLQPFFAIFALPALNIDLWIQMENYFFSVYQNTLTHLVWFLIAFTAFFLGRHVLLSLRFKYLRKKIPLVIGGWGSRGKSGTERLKSALFNGIGLSVLSKTTGCEAMVLHCHRHGSLRELGLFRPYEKATIWEQMQVVKMAVDLKSDVFLWECMGLTPSYIKILQQHWMHDDIATITNCYPDHEDLQGPAGINIPEVMCHFIPSKGTLITSEIEMLPLLREGARQQHTELVTVPWLSQVLLCQDIIDYFPYEEHPSNIALVLAMANKLAIKRDFALQSMAENVVADIGVLNCFPYASVNGRRLQFINGMSANERFATMENWRRMHFDTLAKDNPVDIWLSTVINNRADRISRSKVFAQLLVEDLIADRHYLVGSNLDGMQNYIEEAWQSEMTNFSLWAKGDDTALTRYDKACNRLRIARLPDRIKEQLAYILKTAFNELTDDNIESMSSYWHKPDMLLNKLNTLVNAEKQSDHQSHIVDDIIRFTQQQHQEYSTYQSLYQRIDLAQSANNNNQEQLNKKCLQQLWDWFQSRIIIVDDAKPSRLLSAICQHSPPAINTRIMGLQNIKGPGLGFVYMWRAWESFQLLTDQVLNGRQVERQKALNQLSNINNFSPLCTDYGKHWLQKVHALQSSQNAQTQDQLKIIENTLNKALYINNTVKNGKNVSRWHLLFQVIEAILDPGHAVKRRKRADRIYKTLASEHISHEAAAGVIANLNIQQSNGWLIKKLNKIKTNIIS